MRPPETGELASTELDPQGGEGEEGETRGFVNDPGEAETVQGDEDSRLSLGHTKSVRALGCSWT